MKNVTLINLTPHEINVITFDDTEKITIPPSGIIARCSVTETIADKIVTKDGRVIDIKRQMLGNVENLPDPNPSTKYIVSRVVAEAASDRIDLLVPGAAVRDDKGKIIGCVGFITIE